MRWKTEYSLNGESIVFKIVKGKYIFKRDRKRRLKYCLNSGSDSKMKKYLLEKAIKFIRYSQEKTYRCIVKNKTKCLCFVCKVRMRYIDYRVKLDMFYVWLITAKWVKVEFWGSDYSDFREYKVISKQKVRMDGKGMQWPKTDYNHIKMVELGAV